MTPKEKAIPCPFCAGNINCLICRNNPKYIDRLKK